MTAFLIIYMNRTTYKYDNANHTTKKKKNSIQDNYKISYKITHSIIISLISLPPLLLLTLFNFHHC
jgi:hypothetical protein